MASLARSLRNRLAPSAGNRVPPDFDPELLALIDRVRPFTMTSDERLSALREAIRYVVRNDIPGDFVECGVWRGGSSMMAALALREVGDTSRQLFLFDTFEGMSEPTDADRDGQGRSAAQLLAEKDRSHPVWAYAPMDDVHANLVSTGYPSRQIQLVRGRVEDTMPDAAPEEIAVLRLDTDWYESTRHELEHLVRRMAPYGVLIIDDYGHWEGARKAVDEWLATVDRPVLLNRIDYTGRVAVIPPIQPPSTR